MVDGRENLLRTVLEATHPAPGPWTLSVEIAITRTEMLAAVFLPKVATIPLLFTVDAAAVRLPVHPGLL